MLQLRLLKATPQSFSRGLTHLRWFRRDLTETLWIEALRLSVYLHLLPDTPELW